MPDPVQRNTMKSERSGSSFYGWRIVGVAFVVDFIAVGFFFYVNTKSWIAAGAVGLVGAITIVVLHLVDPTLFEGLIVETMDWFSLIARFDSFTLGLLKLEETVFYLSFTSVFLFVTVRIIEKRRWA